MTRLFFSLAVFALLGALPAPWLTPGETQPSSPSKPRSLSGSETHSQTWERLSAQFDLTLQRHEQTLTELYQRLEASENSGKQLTSLLEQSLSQNSALKGFNQQIGERMQARDEDLAASYAETDRLKRTNRTLSLITGGGAVLALLLLCFKAAVMVFRLK